MKAKHSVWKTKLVNTTLFLTAILVAALFLGTAASAGIATQSTPTINAKKEMYIPRISSTGISSSQCPQVMAQSSPVPPNPKGDIIFTQGPMDPSGAWNFYTSSATFPYTVADDFVVADEIGDIHWYGCALIWNSGWYVGDPAGMTFDITFYEQGTGGTPGAVVATFTGVTPEPVATGQVYSWIGTSYYWEVTLDSTVSLTEGWVSIQSTYCPDGSNFLWLNSPDGDVDAVQQQSGSWVFLYANTAFDLTAPDIQLDHDIGVTKITQPSSGNAGVITPEITVKNFGLYDEFSVPISFEIGKKQYATVLEEHFEGAFPPAGWNVQTLVGTWGWERNDVTGRPNLAGTGYCAIADEDYHYSYPVMTYLKTPTFDLTGIISIALTLSSYEYVYASDQLTIDVSIDGGTTWANLYSQTGAYEYGVKKALSLDLTPYCGNSNVQVRFGYYAEAWSYYWEIDDVMIASYVLTPEYPVATQYVDILAGETLDLAFPTWTPSDLGVTENVIVEYKAVATSALFGDEKPANDVKEKEFTLSYGWLNDVKVNEIVSPVSGTAQSQIPEAIIENVGQLAETATVNMVISKIQYGAQWYQEQHSGQGLWERWELAGEYAAPTAYGSGPYMIADSDAHSGQTYDVSIYTASMDMTGETSVTFSCAENFQDLGADDTARISILSGGVSQGDAYYQFGTSDPSGGGFVTYTFDPSTFPVPSDVQIEFYYNTGVGTWDWGFAIDTVLLVGSTTFIDWNFDNPTFPPAAITLLPEYNSNEVVSIAAGEVKDVVFSTAWVPSDLPVLMDIDYKAEVQVTLGGFNSIYNYGFEEAWIPATPAVPPTPFVGWDFETWPAGWTQTDTGWVQYSSNPTGGTGFCAELPYYSAADGEWFMSPAVDTTSQSALTLSFKTFIDWYGDSDTNFWVETRANSGDTWTDRTPWANPMTGNYLWSGNVDITDDIGTGTQVRFVFTGYYVDFDYWYIDDVIFGSGGTPATAGHWPSFNQYTYGTSTDQWFPVTSGSYPTCSPPEGTYMAEYNSWDVSSGNSAELDGTVLVDFTTATQMKFKMMHDTGYNAGDVIYPLLSADGVMFWYDGTGFYQYDGTNGWKTETMDYSYLISYLGGPGNYYIGFYAVSDFGYNMFIDDVQVGYLGDLPDGNPSDNYMSKDITLSYVHDVGVVSITEPQGPPKRDLIWDNDLTYGEALLACQFDGTNEYGSCADDFQFTQAMDITDLTWVGGFWNGAPGQPDWTITIYSDASGPGDIVYGPVTIPYADCNEQFLEQSGTTYYYSYAATLPAAVICDAGVKYWIGFQAQMVFPPQSGMAGHTAPQQLSEMMFKSAYFGYPDWVPGSSVFGTVYDLAFQLNGIVHQGGGGGNWPPGSYPVAGVVQNLGVTYTETDIPVNAQITNDTGVVVYNFDAVVPGPLAPGEMAAVTFPNIDIPWDVSAEGDYKLTMKTMLPNDSNSGNDKKTKTWIIQIPDTTPPTTTATVSGTMGQNDWYVSNVQVTLTAVDFKWPLGVNHTYYKIDTGAWTEYTVPIVVDTDGQHTVYFYSDDKAIPPNVEEEQNVSFKIDKTAPVINSYNATAQNFMKTKWLLVADATDPMSGIVLVEFYADDALVGSVTTTPYEFIVDGKIHTTQCIVYDAAGNSKISDVVVSYEVGSQQQSLNGMQIFQQKLI